MHRSSATLLIAMRVEERSSRLALLPSDHRQLWHK